MEWLVLKMICVAFTVPLQKSKKKKKNTLHFIEGNILRSILVILRYFKHHRIYIHYSGALEYGYRRIFYL